MEKLLNALHDAGPEVRIRSTQSVFRTSPTPRHGFFLPGLDILWRDIHYNRRLLFYESPQTYFSAASSGDADRHCCSAVSEQLKKSLSDCLVHYFPWCGRLALGSEPPHRLFIDCNDAGVEFVEAFIDMPISVLAQDGFQMKRFFEELCQMPDHQGDSLFSSPLLSVQVTFFSDNGFALGVTQSHVVADGHSLWNFMISWSECSRGLRLSLPPLHDRERLALREVSQERASLWSLTLPVEEEPGTDSMATSEDEDKAREEEAAAPSTANGPENSHAEVRPSSGEHSDPLVQCAMELPASAVKALKKEAGESFSSYEVICAHLWQRITACRQMKRSDPVYFTTLANCRRRIEPPLPSAYFGNVIAFNVVLSTAGNICSETLQATTSRIHELVVAVQESITDFMHFIDAHNATVVDIILRNRYRNLGKGHNVASSPRFPVYEVDFGWGRPLAVRAAKVAGEGEIVFFGGRPGSTQGDVEICIALPSTVLKRLLEDPRFLGHLPHG